MIPNQLLVQLNNVLPITKTLPALTKFSSAIIPKPLQIVMLQQVFNRLFAKEIQEDELSFLTDKTLAIVISDLKTSPLLFSLKNDKLVVTFSQREQSNVLCDNHADVCITGQLNSFILLASQQVDPDTLFFKRQLTITGSTDLGLQIKNFLDTIELEQLPTLFEQLFRLYHQEIQEVS